MNTIANRLRGRYPVGPFQPDGEPEFGWRTFEVDLLPELKKPSALMLEAADYIDRLEKTLKAYEAWEADVILNGDWSGSTVKLTQNQHDRLIEIQDMRNSALRENERMKES